MNVNNYLLIWIAFLALISHLFNTTTVIKTDGYEKKQENKILAVIAFLPVLFLAAFGKPSTDIPVYIKVKGDDTTSPRFVLGNKTGSVTVY